MPAHPEETKDVSLELACSAREALELAEVLDPHPRFRSLANALRRCVANREHVQSPGANEVFGPDPDFPS